MKAIQRETALKLIAKLDSALLPKAGEVVLLETGAKLCAIKRGCTHRYYVYGYAADGSDVANLFIN